MRPQRSTPPIRRARGAFKGTPLSFGRARLQEAFKGTLFNCYWGQQAAFGFVGRGGRIRTDDHLNPIQVRYQAALHPGLAYINTVLTSGKQED